MSSTSVTETTNETNDAIKITRTMDGIVLGMFREYFNATDNIDGADGEFWTSIMSNQGLSLADLTNETNITTTTNVLEKILQTTPAKSLDLLKAAKDDTAKLGPTLAAASASLSLEMLIVALTEMAAEGDFNEANEAAAAAVKQHVIDQEDGTAAEELTTLLKAMDNQWGVKAVVHVADAMVKLKAGPDKDDIGVLPPEGVRQFEAWVEADGAARKTILTTLVIALAAAIPKGAAGAANFILLSSTIISEQGENFEKAVAALPSGPIVAGLVLALKMHITEDQVRDKENIRLQTYVKNQLLNLLATD